MVEAKAAWKAIVARALAAYIAEKGAPVEAPAASAVVLERPPKPELGDFGFPMFPYAKLLRAAPPAVAAALAALIAKDPEAAGLGEAKAEGPYLNVRLARAPETARILSAVAKPGWGASSGQAGHKVLVEFSSPNTNKPLHLGHLRNNALGESLSRILLAAGAEVRKVNHLNDRGINICKSMLAYLRYGEGKTPADEGLKGDHFVGKYYVLYNKLKAEDPNAEADAQELVRRWEAGDPEIRALQEKMNAWTFEGVKATYARTGVSFDAYDFETETYEQGRAEVLKGLERGVFFKEEDGSVQIDLEDVGLDKKVLLRKDGTSIYITQDIGTAIHRHEGWPYDRVVYVVGNEQVYHFKVLFEVLKRLGFDWANDLHHLSYGMVNLPTGRMKTREGTIVDADDLVDAVAELAAKEIEAKGREESAGAVKDIAGKIALGSLHYFLLHVAPVKDILYDPAESLSFTGDTGPYIQYMGARASSILRKHAAGEGNAVKGRADPALLAGEADWELLKLVAALPECVDQAAAAMEPSVMAGYAHDLAAGFSAWYRDNPVLNCPDPNLAASRLELVKAVKAGLEKAAGLVCIPFLETM
ncbi:MAG: arginine--tRNA ligase [Spirochaetaceae bacterium]|nr:arginine--tRNA ligase [Spirochaetaceae bacterium]